MKIRHLTYFLIAPILTVFSQENIQSYGQLPGEVNETSGLLYFNGRLITHNDSGSAPHLYEIDTVSLEISRTVAVENVSNNDWEDIAQDEQYIYVGDIGNNNGSRTDLAVYRIVKSEYETSSSVTAEVINFSYEDQTDFSGQPRSDWDAEGMIIQNGKVILFTKGWQSRATDVYSFPAVPGDHIATKIATYQVNGLVTGATLNTASNALFLTGYNELLSPFVLRMDNVPEEFSFNSTVQKSILPLGMAQIEAITWKDENTYVLSSERFTNESPPIVLEAQLFKFSTADEPPEEEPTPEDPPEEMPGSEDPRSGVILYRNSRSPILSYVVYEDRQLFGRAIYDTSGREIRYSVLSEMESNEVDISTLPSAVYYLTFYFSGGIISKPFAVY